MVKELKRELSRLSGVDFFNPKYREAFKKFFPDDADEAKEEAEDEAAETNAEEVKGFEETKGKIEENEQDAEVSERESDGDEEEGAEQESEEEDEYDSEDPDDYEEKSERHGIDPYAELLEARIENELLRGGVREDRLEHAMRLAKSEICCIEELHKVKDILNDFPEWVRAEKPKGYGMEVDPHDGLTAEERRLKEMGIDPKE